MTHIERSHYKNFIAGGLSGLVEVCFTHPLDYFKTKIQELSISDKKNANLKYVIKNTKGLNGFYIGILPRLIGIAPMRLIYWGTLETTNTYCKKMNLHGYQKSLTVGIVCGLAQTTIDNPIEIIKTQIMTGGKINMCKKSCSTIDAKLCKLKTHHVKPCEVETSFISALLSFRGFYATLARNIVFASCVNYSLNYQKNNNHFHNFIMCALGGFIGSVISQPFDTIKTELQRNHHGDNITNRERLIKLYISSIKNPSLLWSGGFMRALLGFVNMGVGGLVFTNIKQLI